jgi:aspartate-semialdehyde dehydrogenase
MAKIPVAILGGTGTVGQRFVQLLASHPWFEIVALAASERSVGRCYADACHWVIPGDPPDYVRQMKVSPLEPTLPGRIMFSALPSSVARDVEPVFAKAGYVVCSNASAFRCMQDVPLIIPEVNPDHLALVDRQRAERGWPGFIVTSPNCSTTGIAMALKPLHDAFGLSRFFAATMQAVSGAGYPGVPSLDILDNVLPYISGEEEKIEQETKLLLGHIADGRRIDAEMVISAQTNRVPVMDGHTACLSAAFNKEPTVDQAILALRDFRGPPPVPNLPSAPQYPILVRTEQDRPQPRRDRDAAQGMAVTVGRLRPCPLMNLRMVTVVHNTLRGAAGGAILNAELLVASAMVD